MLSSNLDILKFMAGKGNLDTGIIYKDYCSVDYIEVEDILEQYRDSFRKLASFLDNAYFKCIVDVKVFLNENDNNGTRGIPVEINGIPTTQTFIPFSYEDSDEREMVISIYDILEIKLKGYDFKLKSYSDIPKLHKVLTNFINAYNEMLYTSYNRLIIAEDIINEAKDIIDILETRYFSTLRYETNERKLMIMKRKLLSKSIVDRLEILNYDIENVTNFSNSDSFVSEDQKQTYDRLNQLGFLES